MPQWFTNAIDKAFGKLAKKLHEGEKQKTDAELLALVGKLLQETVTESFGSDFASVDYDTPDATMLARLTRDVWHFSAAKNYQQLRDMTLALRDENGKLREFADFKTEAEKISNKFNQTWLRTEYNTAIASSQMASRWTDAQARKEAAPYLRYETASDKRVRDEHAKLDGITRKIDDEFWQTHFPPNGYGCRCDVSPTASGKETKDIPEVSIPEMFRTNLAQNGLVYPKGHAYFDGVPAKELERALLYLPHESVYNTIETEVDAMLQMHILHGTQEMKENVAIGKQLLKAGHNVDLLPVVNHLSGKERKKLFGKDLLSETKVPDAKVNGKLFEFKQAKSTKTGIHNAMRRAKEQATSILIYLPEAMDIKEAERFIKGRWSRDTEVKEVWLINGSKLNKYKKADLGL